MALDQATRMLQCTTPLGENVLLLTSFRGHEQLSRLGKFELDFISDNPSVPAKDIVGKPVGFSTAYGEDKRRQFHGFVNRFYAGDETKQGRRAYRAEVVPWLWFLTRTSDCRIFQFKTGPEIIEQIFKDLGFSDYKLSLQRTYTQREYCVQYRETDFNFVSRIMEEEGIFYYVEHSAGKHELILGDSPNAYGTCEESRVDFPRNVGPTAVKDHITSWEHAWEFRSGKWAQQDYNFETPFTDLMTKANGTLPFPDSSKFEYYDYPGLYRKSGEGKPLTDSRLEEEELDHDVVYAASLCRSFTVGCKFTVGDHHSASEEGQSYLITAVHHMASEPQGYEAGTERGLDYSNTFSCVPAKTPCRAPRLTPKPVIQGTQTAVVVGPKGEEIYCDKYGRVKVQFYWDREGKKDENSSCWIRSAHNIAGKKWGFLGIPRIGQEVVVDFLEGDPDRPVIVGSVYNADQMPHYALPEHMTRTYIKTNSSKGGVGFNELMFEDKKGEERVFLHAEKDQDFRVKAECRERIGASRHLIVGGEKDGKKYGDQKEQVYKDKHLHVKGSQEEHIGGDYAMTVGYGEDKAGGNFDVVVEKDCKLMVEKNMHQRVKENLYVKVDKNIEQEVKGSMRIKCSKNLGLKVNNDVHVKSTGKIVIEAAMGITLKGPGGFITIAPSGVMIQGMTVLINSGGAALPGHSQLSPKPGQNARKAKPVAPDEAWNSTSGVKSAPDGGGGGAAPANLGAFGVPTIEQIGAALAGIGRGGSGGRGGVSSGIAAGAAAGAAAGSGGGGGAGAGGMAGALSDAGGGGPSPAQAASKAAAAVAQGAANIMAGPAGGAMQAAGAAAQKAAEMAAEAAKKTEAGQAVADAAKQAKNDAVEAAKQAASDAAESAQQAAQKAADKAQQTAQDAQEGIQQAKQKAKEAAQEAAEAAQQAAEQAAEKAAEEAQRTAEKAQETAQKVAQKAQEGIEQAQQKAIEAAAQAAQKAAETAQQAAEKAQQAAQDAAEQAAQKASDAAQSVSDGIQQAQQKASDAAQGISDALGFGD